MKPDMWMPAKMSIHFRGFLVRVVPPAATRLADGKDIHAGHRSRILCAGCEGYTSFPSTRRRVRFLLSAAKGGTS